MTRSAVPESEERKAVKRYPEWRDDSHKIKNEERYCGFRERGMEEGLFDFLDSERVQRRCA